MTSYGILRYFRRQLYNVCLRFCPARPPWLLIVVAASWSLPTQAQEASWIWSPEHRRGDAPAGVCYFRKSFEIGTAEQAVITITADDQYELFVNGRRIGAGNSIRQMEQYRVGPLLKRGLNVIAVKVVNRRPGPAALAARVFVKPQGGDWVSYSTDQSWVTSLNAPRDWASLMFNDSRWAPARVYGLLGQTVPWDHREDVPANRTSEGERFQVSPEFEVVEILGDDDTGSLINMAFNEFGHLIASREGGPLLLIYDSDQDGTIDRVREYGDLVKNVQGILPLNGDVYVTGEGQDGVGIYRLVDTDRDGGLDEATLLVEFDQTSAEHGVHGLTLGPDGMIYCVFGNHARLKAEPASTSTLRNYYEGDVVTPRYEDPGGHARGIKAPGGGIVRCDLEGQRVELIAGGLRNAYDLTFDRLHRLFVHDSDMEADEGAPWYRPPSVYEVAEGGEYGWRSGWAKWPIYYFDRLPPVFETGRGSPTGCCLYDHFMFPQRFHGNLFLADWTAGEIIAVRIEESGGVQHSVFLRGQPLNVTDLAVGPDGWLYFCTGGRGTRGGIYQVRWKGKVPDAVTNLGSGIRRVLRQPQLDAAWARQTLATLQSEMGADWDGGLISTVINEDASPRDRIRALSIMQLLGPAPSVEALIDVSRSSSAAIRRQCAMMFWTTADDSSVQTRLNEMLRDPEPSVQIAAAETLLRSGQQADLDALIPMLASTDRRVAWAARRLLEQLPTSQWRDKLLEAEDQRVRLQAGLALMIAEPSAENATATVSMVIDMLDEFIADRNFADLLRLVEVALHRSELPAAELETLKAAMIREYPIGHPLLNRELVRILAALQADTVVPQLIASLESDAPLADRLHTAMHLRFFAHDWTADQRMAVLRFLEQFNNIDCGGSVPLYVMNVTRDLCRDLPLEEARILVSEGAKWPNAALVSLYRFPEHLSENDLQMLIRLDKQIDRPGFEAEHFKRLRTGIVAMLTQHGSPEAFEYLREIWIRNPERRQVVALGLATQPNDENWDYLVRSLPVLESYAVTEVMAALQQVPVATDDTQAIREVILHGLRMERDGRSPQPAIRLLKYWTGRDLEPNSEQSAMAPWQQWFAETYPDELPAELPQTSGGSRWTMKTLSEFFATAEGRRGDPARGREVYEKAQCARCHRFGEIGNSIGPDLTYVRQRFTRDEVLESILFPSQDISDQYLSHRVLTRDGKVYVGIIVPGLPGAVTIRDAELNEHVVPEQDVELIERSNTSMMPTGLLDEVSAEEIRDLMTFLGYLPARSVASQPGTEPLQR